ncbi:PspA/IM30 family protein [Streptacidiphilus pinicola]|uniref:PspA/IM30 family protein n=1 Tax=Streptacidiphilus pinicola TaxID=2219663 RepID=A0A2X0KJH3_9ACTN|nr:PspA/IM30 family protein [Streptacidiphilus pinicola]RAG86870.1 PspA/IM30 family protein [Streptacidiphilus pinicola]
MGVVHRVTDLFRIKANKALDRAEDPREMLDYAYQRQLDLLQQVRRGLADVATSRKRIELQRTQLGRSAETLQGQAQQALTAGREDLAREALGRRTAVLAQDQELQAQLVTLQEEEQKLTSASKQLEAKVEDFRTRKETVKASYTAAEAQTRVGEAAAGISGEMGDIGTAIQRAQDRTEQLQARAGALDELMASGALEDATSPVAHDDLRDELDALTAGDGVETQLAAMKAELAAGRTTPPASLEPAPDHAAQDDAAQDRAEQDQAKPEPAEPEAPEAPRAAAPGPDPAEPGAPKPTPPE